MADGLMHTHNALRYNGRQEISVPLWRIGPWRLSILPSVPSLFVSTPCSPQGLLNVKHHEEKRESGSGDGGQSKNIYA